MRYPISKTFKNERTNCHQWLSCRRDKWNNCPRWQRFLATLLFVPSATMATGATLYYLDMHRQNENALPKTLFPAPQKRQKYLVFSPHCDDETLALGGFIADATQKGTPTSVAFLTNGDGFRVSASEALHTVSPTPADFIRFGEMRQKEATGALGELGVTPNHIFFLGYPDRGLQSLWEKYWGEEDTNTGYSHNTNVCYTSAFTQVRFNPYKNTYHAKAPYTGKSVVQDIASLIAQEKPTDIFVTHPYDDHPDHSAAPSFVQAAIEKLREEKNPLASQIHLHYYIVHRGDWPLPQGYTPNYYLLPPTGLQESQNAQKNSPIELGNTQWSNYTPSAKALEAKARSLKHYASQTRVSNRFLWSFIKKNEIIGHIKVVPNQTTVHWQDAVGDNWVRYSNPACDLTGLYVQQEQAGLRIRLTTHQAVSPLFRYQIQVHRAIEAKTETEEISPSKPITLFHSLSPATGSSNAAFLETTFSWKELGLDKTTTPSTLWVGAETHWTKDMLVDRMGYQSIVISPRVTSPSPDKNSLPTNINSLPTNINSLQTLSLKTKNEITSNLP